MRVFLFLPVLALLFAGCSKANEKMTVEEEIVTNAFTGFVAADTYDSVCGGKKLADHDLKKNKAFEYYMGNRQLFGSRLGTLWKIRHPDGTMEQAIASLVATEKNIAGKITATLKEKGCGSEPGQQGKQMYDLYTKTHPAKINDMLDKSIVKAGGKVTPADAVDTSPPKKK